MTKTEKKELTQRVNSLGKSELLEEFEPVAETFGRQIALAGQAYIIQILRRQGELGSRG